MRQPESNSQPESTHSEHKTTHPTKRIAKKDRHPHPNDDRPNHKILTKEERALIQKEKNREAAQRSRDQHREYVMGLEREVSELREQVQRNRQFCWRCRGELEHAPRDGFFDIHQQDCPNDSGSLPVPGVKMEKDYEESVVVKQEEESLVRLMEPEEEHSMWKMVLFVAMIAVGVMVINSAGSGEIDHKRALMQTYAMPETTPVAEEAPQTATLGEKCSPNQRGLVRTAGGIDNEMCLESLMKVETPLLRRSLRSVHDQQLSHEGILVCSLKMPKAYPVTPELTDSPLVRLFVLGSEIKEMLTPSLRALTDSNIQLNGIYRIDAEVKKVDLVPHHNCLL